MIRHKFDLGACSGELVILPAGIGNIPRFIFTTSIGDIYEGAFYEQAGVINPNGSELEYMFRIAPALEAYSQDAIEIVFGDNGRGIGNATARLYRLSAARAEAQQKIWRAADNIIASILTERIRAMERSAVEAAFVL